MYPLFLDLTGRPVVLVGGGPVAASKLRGLLDASATVSVVAPSIDPTIARTGATMVRRAFRSSDLDGSWYAVAAATPEVNRQVFAAAQARRIFVNAVDDPAHASAYLGAVLRRQGVTAAISTDGQAPALAGLLREALDELLPTDLGRWLAESRRLRAAWKARRVPIAARRPLLLDALNRLYSHRQDRVDRWLGHEGERA